MLNTTDDDYLRPLNIRAPTEQEPDEIELLLNVQKRNFVSHNRQETDTLDERLAELEQTKMRLEMAFYFDTIALLYSLIDDLKATADFEIEITN